MNVRTLYLLLEGAWNPGDVLRLWGPQLSQWFDVNAQRPVVHPFVPPIVRDEFDDLVVASGPFEGLSVEGAGPITAIKWNLPGPDGDEGEARAALRTGTMAKLRAEGYAVHQMSLKPYGRPLSGDRGLPTTPAAPTAPGPVQGPPAPAIDKPKSGWWLLAAAALALALGGG